MRRRWRHVPESIAGANTNPRAHSYADTDADANPHADSDPDANSERRHDDHNYVGRSVTKDTYGAGRHARDLHQ